MTGLQGETYTGVSGEWHSNTIQIYNTNYFADHANEAIWVYTTTDEQYIVEIGVRIGWVTSDWEQKDCNGCFEYAAYSTENTPLAGGTEYRHWISNTPINGSNHTYAMVADPNYPSVWQIWYDGSLLFYTSHQTSSTGYEVQAGAEAVNVPDLTNYHFDTFDQQPLKSRDSSGMWNLWPYFVDWIDQPCGSWPPGNCFNGYAPYSWYWQNNKP